MKQLAGRTAIVTGASAGIGRAVAVALGQHGMNVVLAARSCGPLETAAEDVRRTGASALAVAADVADHAARERLVEAALERFGSIDVLVNNAGMQTFQSFHERSVEDIVATVNVNLTSALVLARLVVPVMLAQSRGHIVNMASTAGKHGPPFGAPYGATKAGLIAMTESLRAEYAGTGLSASAICPGFTNEGGIYERMKDACGRGTPLTMGATSVRAVTRAVVKAIRRDRPEVLVNFPPMRPFCVLAELFPRLGDWLVRKTVVRYLRRVAQATAAGDSQPTSRAA
ncbi:MAG: SDR family NAD(P)-dependent oxidoreductase [Planctomycetes bacterium]|nr:SDR family NAD(P)-dependent oxidoreductase [Planctomycetota bacterium]